MPLRSYTSRKFTPAASTATTSASGSCSGGATSWSSSTSDPPIAVTTHARTSTSRLVPGAGDTPATGRLPANLSGGAMPGRWVTFDCYGTIVDWNAGLAAALAEVFGDEPRGALIAGFDEAERRVKHADGYRRY